MSDPDENFYRVTVMYDASKSFETYARTPEDSILHTDVIVERPVLCHQCSDEVDLGEIMGYLVHDQAGNEVLDTLSDLYVGKLSVPADEKPADPEAVKKALSDAVATYHGNYFDEKANLVESLLEAMKPFLK